MRNHYQPIPDWSRPRLPTTASGVAQQFTCENYPLLNKVKIREEREEEDE